MKNVKAPASITYQDYLIPRLKRPGYAAVYLETHLEDDGEDFDPDLLRFALDNVSQALSQSSMSPEQAEQHRQKLEEILTPLGSQEIYQLAGWLKELGLKLTVAVDDEDESES